MPYNLTVETEPEAKVARLTLTDDAGVQKGANLVRMAEHPLSLWEGLFDTRRHVDRYAESMLDDEDQEITDERILFGVDRNGLQAEMDRLVAGARKEVLDE